MTSAIATRVENCTLSYNIGTKIYSPCRCTGRSALRSWGTAAAISPRVNRPRRRPWRCRSIRSWRADLHDRLPEMAQLWYDLSRQKTGLAYVEAL